MKNWIHRTKESERDFYQTNELMVEALLQIIRPAKCLDPCCGNHAIKNVFKKHGISIGEFDKNPQDENTIGSDFLFYRNIEKKFSTIVMNPPYSQKYLFLDNALNNFDNVLCLLPEISLNYNIMNSKYLTNKRYYGKIKMFPKMFLHEGIENKFGGTTCYSWLIFNNIDNGDKKIEIIIDLLKGKDDDRI